MVKEILNRGKTVTAAGTGINLALGVLYTWSIFKEAISRSVKEGGPGAFNWDPASLNDPYAVCCLVFACAMIIAGKCQDIWGPRLTAVTGGLLAGLGFIWISQTTEYSGWIFGFGLLVGSGIAFGYASATPPALKWYPPAMTGRIAGIVVAGFGLASVYAAPLAQYLLYKWGMQGAMLFFGLAFFVVVGLLSMFLVDPPEGYVPEGFVDRRLNTESNMKTRELFANVDLSPSEVLRTPSFWMLWILYFIGAGAGLMVIGSLAGMAKSSLGGNAFLAVAILAVGNAGGRVTAGIVSDKIGRTRTLAAVFSFQAVLLFAAVLLLRAETASPVLLVLLSTLIGFNYGANLSLFPSFAKDFWGIRNFGVNYGILFTAWGAGGFVMSRVSQSLIVSTKTFTAALVTAGLLLVAGTVLTFFVKDRQGAARREIAKRLAAV